MFKKLQVAALTGMLNAAAICAPLFPDVPDQHWARDAVAALAAQGLVTGYPDGSFKGDRAASRWEMAMVVARLLARMEQEHATLATREQLQALRGLVAALREELDALGVRVQNLEEQAGRLEERVSELERITFYGSVKTRAGFQNVKSVGSAGTPLVNYQTAVGSATGAGGLVPGTGLVFDPFIFGIMPVLEWTKGVPLTNGSTFTTDARLGLRMFLSEDLRGELELAAYTSQGDPLVDAYFGQPAAYLLNPFTATGPADHQPFTRMVLDHLWLRHDPSRTELTLGTFASTSFDPVVYVPTLSPMAYGPKYLGNFGAQLRGSLTLAGDDEGRDVWMDYDLMGTVLPDGNAGPAGYFSTAEGVNLGFFGDQRRAVGRVNFLHAANHARGGAALQTGLISNTNNYTAIPWVNPSGFYVNQLGAAATAGIGSTTDVRPIVMGTGLDGVTGLAGVPNTGQPGPQDENLLGLSFSYTFDHEAHPFIRLDYARSDYSPQKNSSYRVGGNAYRIQLGAALLEGDLSLKGEVLRVDPTYDPFQLQIPAVGGILFNHWRFPELDYYPNLYSLHDTEAFPQNREGFRLFGDWRFDHDPRPEVGEARGRIYAHYSQLAQVRTSLQDVRFSTGALGAGTPNSPLLGFSPGFVEPIYGGFSPYTFAPSGGNALGAVLENPRGSGHSEGAGLSYKFMVDPESARGVRPSLEYHRYTWVRPSSLSSLVPGPAGLIGEDVNAINFWYQKVGAGVTYDATDALRLRLGYDQIRMYGHWDPNGTYGLASVLSGKPQEDTVDLLVHNPFVGLDWDVTESTAFGLEARFYSTDDRLEGDEQFPTPSSPNTNQFFGPQRSAHPFDWRGIQLTSTFSVSF